MMDSECGPDTLAALEKAIAALEDVKPSGQVVRISGGNCYIRTAPNTDGRKLSVAHNGDALPFGGQVSDAGWLLVQYDGQNAWVSGKYSKVC